MVSGYAAEARKQRVDQTAVRSRLGVLERSHLLVTEIGCRHGANGLAGVVRADARGSVAVADGSSEFRFSIDSVGSPGGSALARGAERVTAVHARVHAVRAAVGGRLVQRHAPATHRDVILHLRLDLIHRALITPRAQRPGPRFPRRRRPVIRIGSGPAFAIDGVHGLVDREPLRGAQPFSQELARRRYSNDHNGGVVV